MKTKWQELIGTAYTAFNERDIEKALSTFHPLVEWPKAFEGGYVSGHEEISAYWTRQWKEIDPHVEPIEIIENPNGSLEVQVHQVVKDLEGNLLFDGMVKHIYSLQDNLLRRMEIKI